jgi:hypothetical protein
MLALHGHFSGAAFLFLLAVVIVAAIIACRPAKSQDK